VLKRQQCIYFCVREDGKRRREAAGDFMGPVCVEIRNYIAGATSVIAVLFWNKMAAVCIKLPLYNPMLCSMLCCCSHMKSRYKLPPKLVSKILETVQHILAGMHEILIWSRDTNCPQNWCPKFLKQCNIFWLVCMEFSYEVETQTAPKIGVQHSSNSATYFGWYIWNSHMKSRYKLPPTLVSNILETM
jgi:hypothetical protein